MQLDHGSPSLVTTYLDCSMKAYYNLTRGYTPPSIFIIAGCASEEGLNENFKHKQKTGNDLKSSIVKEAILAEWDRKKQYDGILEPDPKEGEKKDATVDTTLVYHKEIAPKIIPESIQRPVKITFPPEMKLPPIHCVLDLETQDAIDDWKLSFSVLSKDGKGLYIPRFNHSMQLGCYRLVNMKKKLYLHYLFPEKKPNVDGKKYDCLILQVPEITDYFIQQYTRVIHAIRNDVFIPNRNSNLCSPKYCGHTEICFRENKQ